MNRIATLSFVILAGLAGGVASRYFVPVPVFAQAQPSVAKEVRAESFILTDESGTTIGVFTSKSPRFADKTRPLSEQRTIVLLDANGKQIWSAGDSPLRQLSRQ